MAAGIGLCRVNPANFCGIIVVRQEFRGLLSLKAFPEIAWRRAQTRS